MIGHIFLGLLVMFLGAWLVIASCVDTWMTWRQEVRRGPFFNTKRIAYATGFLAMSVCIMLGGAYIVVKTFTQ